MIDSRDFSAALKPATEAVAMQAKTRDADYPTDLTTLARIQAELGQIDKAEANYLAAISAVEAAEGEFSLELLSPTAGSAAFTSAPADTRTRSRPSRRRAR